MGDDINLGSICFDFRLSAAEYVVYGFLTTINDTVTEPEPMSSPIDYPAYPLLKNYVSNQCKDQIVPTSEFEIS